jgi:hypothetical protein
VLPHSTPSPTPDNDDDDPLPSLPLTTPPYHHPLTTHPTPSFTPDNDGPHPAPPSTPLPLPNIINDYRLYYKFYSIAIVFERPKRTLKKILDLAFEA